jgi:threonine/homoserine/homoserine lactone efflux protein
MILFLIQTVIISLSGVMAPGPITAVTVGSGTRSSRSGVFIALGHGVVEMPLIVLIYFGLGHVLAIGSVKAVIFSLGSVFLFVMGADMLRSLRSAHGMNSVHSGTPFVAGMLLSLGNVYFLIWWATVGASLITKAVAFGLVGILSFAVVHWLCDLVWLTILSTVSYKSGHAFGARFQHVVFVICGIFLIVFGGLFLKDAIRFWIVS